MSTTHDVTMGDVHVRGAWNAPGGDVRAELVTYTKTGQARIATLSDAELIQMIADAADALRKLRTHHEVTVRAAMQPDAYVSPGEAGRRVQIEASLRASRGGEIEGPGGARIEPR